MALSKKITIEAARVSCGLTQEQMAEMLGFSRKFYNMLETGQREMKPAYLYAICQITGFKEDDLLLKKSS